MLPLVFLDVSGFKKCLRYLCYHIDRGMTKAHGLLQVIPMGHIHDEFAESCVFLADLQ